MSVETYILYVWELFEASGQVLFLILFVLERRKDEAKIKLDGHRFEHWKTSAWGSRAEKNQRFLFFSEPCPAVLLSFWELFSRHQADCVLGGVGGGGGSDVTYQNDVSWFETLTTVAMQCCFISIGFTNFTKVQKESNSGVYFQNISFMHKNNSSIYTFFWDNYYFLSTQVSPRIHGFLDPM